MKRLLLSQVKPNVGEATVRLWVIVLFLSLAVWLQWNFQPSYPVLLPAVVILNTGLAVYGIWTLWRLWKPRT